MFCVILQRKKKQSSTFYTDVTAELTCALGKSSVWRPLCFLNVSVPLLRSLLEVECLFCCALLQLLCFKQLSSCVSVRYCRYVCMWSASGGVCVCRLLVFNPFVSVWRAWGRGEANAVRRLVKPPLFLHRCHPYSHPYQILVGPAAPRLPRVH